MWGFKKNMVLYVAKIKIISRNLNYYLGRLLDGGKGPTSKFNKFFK